MKLKKIWAAASALALAATLALTGCDGGNASAGTSGSSQTTDVSTPSEPDGITAPMGNNMTSIEAVHEMGNGINLGNTLEAYSHQSYLNGGDPGFFETGWGQPYTTAEMIQGMKDAGFDTIRIPIAWTNGMNFESGDYTIDARLMDRVQQVVDYAIEADMYVIINDHWDGGWWGMFGSEDMAVREQAMELYKSMWTQIGERFKGYSYKLIFEAGNEEFGDRFNDKEITGSKGVLTQDECYEKAYEVNSAFVQTIRAQGGNNADRFLLIAGYNTDFQMTCDERYKMPEDTAEDKLMLSVHYYTPWDYCGTDGISKWGSPKNLKQMNDLFEMMSKYTKEGYGVIIGEYAVMHSSGKIKDGAEKFYANLLDNCDKYDMVPVLWDCSNFFKRTRLETTDETIAELYLSRDRDAEGDMTAEEIKERAEKSLDERYAAAEENEMAEIDLPATDDTAVAWIMFQSGDWALAYSSGDTYDPTNKTTGIMAQNALITGEGTYTVSLDFSECGEAKGIAFSALGIYNGETLFPGSIINIDKVLINNAPYELQAEEYTCSDDGKCTRVNLYNQWVPKAPEDVRTAHGTNEGCSAQIIQLGKKDKISSISITFTVDLP